MALKLERQPMVGSLTMSGPSLHPVPTFVRANEIYGEHGLLRIGRSKFFALIAAGHLPKPLKCGRVSVWERAELLAAFRALVR